MKIYKVILLNSEIGYKLHNKIDDIFCAAVQLPIDSDLSDWEEITNAEAESMQSEQFESEVTDEEAEEIERAGKDEQAN